MVKTFGIFLACHFQSRKYLAERCVMMTDFSISWIIHVLPKYTDDRNITKNPTQRKKNAYKNHEDQKTKKKLTVLTKHIDYRNIIKSPT